MIDLYTWTTPNGTKVSIMLEECGLDYKVFPVDIGSGAQRRAEFLAINPNGKIPAIVDHDGEDGKTRVFESAAILIYLAEKTGKFLPASGAARAETLSWLAWQAANIGPIFGQVFHFLRHAPRRDDYAIERYTGESLRLLTTLDNQLAKTAYLAGEDYSIADIATFSWLKVGLSLLQKDAAATVPELPHTRRWLEAVGAREAVGRGVKVPEV